MPGGFVALFILVVIGGIAMTTVNARKARDLAERAGEDPDRASRRMFFSQDPRAELRNLERQAELHEETERLARSQRETDERLRRAEAAAAAARVVGPADARPAADRLEELQELYRKGLVNEDEFAEKRRQILGDV